MCVRIVDGEAHELRVDGGERLRVARRVGHAALRARARERDELSEAPVDRRDLGAQRSGLAFSGQRIGAAEFAVGILYSRDESLHGVVVLGRDGIELVIVATGAAYAQAEEGLADVGHDLVERILPREPDGWSVLPDLAGQ